MYKKVAFLSVLISLMYGSTEAAQILRSASVTLGSTLFWLNV